MTEPEHLDVLVIGAGLSGIAAGHHLQTSCPWASFAIVEARHAIGGTWDLFRYPGIRSDSDMFTLGYPWKPWAGEKSIAEGASILDYIRETAAEEGIDAHIRFGLRIISASWSTERARWSVVAEHTDDGTRVELTCGFVFSCTGYYRYDRGYTPDFPGRDDFAGRIVHPQFWPDDLDYADEQVVVIGSGATAVTLIPSMADETAHITMLQRSPTYVAALPSADPIADALRRWLPARVSGPVVRWMKALMTQGLYAASRRWPGRVRRLLRRGAEAKLPDGFDIDTHFNPTYDPWDQRLCADADAGLFRALSDGRASVVTDHVDHFDETGIVLASGRHLDADLVITATGLELLFLGGIVVDIDGEPLVVSERMTYKGMMLEGVPNLAIAIGYANASWTLKLDLICFEVTRILNHLRDYGLAQATPTSGVGEASDEPLLGLTSGYVLRGKDQLPRQGHSFPWRVHQSYLKDYRAIRRSPVDHPAITFSSPPECPAGSSSTPEVLAPDISDSVPAGGDDDHGTGGV